MAQRLLLLSLAFLAIGCAHASQLTRSIDDPMVMRATLEDRIPVGTPIAEAQQFMEKEGFECRDHVNGTFVERRSWRDKEPRHERIVFIECSRAQKLGAGADGGRPVNSKWDVALVNDGKVVTAILLSHYNDGP